LDTGANEVLMTRGDSEFTILLCNEVLHCRNIWQLGLALTGLSLKESAYSNMHQAALIALSGVLA